jgi:hypothetical protein
LAVAICRIHHVSIHDGHASNTGPANEFGGIAANPAKAYDQNMAIAEFFQLCFSNQELGSFQPRKILHAAKINGSARIFGTWQLKVRLE